MCTALSPSSSPSMSLCLYLSILIYRSLSVWLYGSLPLSVSLCISLSICALYVLPLYDLSLPLLHLCARSQAHSAGAAPERRCRRNGRSTQEPKIATEGHGEGVEEGSGKALAYRGVVSGLRGSDRGTRESGEGKVRRQRQQSTSDTGEGEMRVVTACFLFSCAGMRYRRLCVPLGATPND